MSLRIQGIPTDTCSKLWRGGADAHGQPAVRRAAEGHTNPCRHCLGLIGEGTPLLLLAYRPFDTLQPYAETGPIFLHAEPCARYDGSAPPAWFAHLEPALLRGYDEQHWIRYETGRVVAGRDIAAASEAILEDPEIAYVHVRSRFNCFQCRVDRG